ncbi:hypothetical protein BN77_p11082 [Rhizobium mesoamericanum STM3625]|uniref:Uncharacterized protein n=1 Tax=Rhizobium mesoamericanum STM3625 TaxID=1211777 RepID=K0PP71_9HYPH|nr:hypothetical protein BN77_p11082 [Rhizobium mesoamericanum STM3625]
MRTRGPPASGPAITTATAGHNFVLVGFDTDPKQYLDDHADRASLGASKIFVAGPNQGLSGTHAFRHKTVASLCPTAKQDVALFRPDRVVMAAGPADQVNA